MAQEGEWKNFVSAMRYEYWEYRSVRTEWCTEHGTLRLGLWLRGCKKSWLLDSGPRSWPEIMEFFSSIVICKRGWITSMESSPPFSIRDTSVTSL